MARKNPAQQKNVPVPGPGGTEMPDEGLGRRVAVGLLAAAMLIGGFVVLLLAAAFAYSRGVPSFVLAFVALGLLAGIFALLRRWAGDGEA